MAHTIGNVNQNLIKGKHVIFIQKLIGPVSRYSIKYVLQSIVVIFSDHDILLFEPYSFMNS